MSYYFERTIVELAYEEQAREHYLMNGFNIVSVQRLDDGTVCIEAQKMWGEQKALLPIIHKRPT